MDTDQSDRPDRNPRTMLALTFALSAPAGRDGPAEDMTYQTRHRRLVADGDISAITRYAISAVRRGFRLLLGRGKRAPYLGLLGPWASPRYREMQHRGGDIGDHETWGSERYFGALNDPAILTCYPPRSSNFPST